MRQLYRVMQNTEYGGLDPKRWSEEEIQSPEASHDVPAYIRDTSLSMIEYTSYRGARSFEFPLLFRPHTRYIRFLNGLTRLFDAVYSVSRCIAISPLFHYRPQAMVDFQFSMSIARPLVLRDLYHARFCCETSFHSIRFLCESPRVADGRTDLLASPKRAR